MPVPIIETTRLRLRPREAADLAAILDMDMQPEVQRYLPQLHGKSRTAHRADLAARHAAGWPATGGLWIVERREASGFLGWCALFPLERTGLIEIGYRYAPPAWGDGIATEAAAAVLDHGFRLLGFDPIVAVTHPENRASQRVLEKVGLRHEGLRRHYGLDLPFFRRTRESHLAADGAAPARNGLPSEPDIIAGRLR